MAPITRIARIAGFALILGGCAQATSAPPTAAPGATSPRGAPVAGPADATAALERALRERITRERAEVAVAFVDLETGRRLSIDGDVVMHAASTMKVPVLLEALRRHDEGTLRLDEQIPVTNRFRSIADSSTYSLSPEDDSDSTLYERIGQTASVRELLMRMITRSSNLATNIMLERFPAADVRTTLARIDGQGMNVLRGVEDTPAFERGMNNTTTADAFARVLESFARCRLLTAAACETGIEILAQQEFNDMIPAGVPPGTRVANKTGSITRIRHDGGIVYPDGRAPYVLVVLTRGFDDAGAADRLGADLSRIVWQHITSDAFTLPSRTGDAGVDSLIALHASVFVPEVGYRRVPHEHYWHTLAPYLGGAVRQEEVGRSAEGRPLYLLRFGNGPRTVLLWSQMHGDESTATMTLADVVRMLHEDGPRTRLWADSLTILMIPMLNPDGAARFRRHSMYGIDINRDARRLSTPEARTLKGVHTRYQPDFGFNLHDQNPRTRVGSAERTAAISLLAPAAGEPGTDRAVATRALHLAATLRDAAEAVVPGHVTRYDDSYNPRAFGDLVQQWGTSTVLIESGGWYDDPEKQVLRRTNFVLLTRAFDAIATGSYLDTPIERYTLLPENGRALRDLVIRNATIVIPGMQPYRADLAIDVQDGPLARDQGSIAEIGDLEGVLARDDFDADGLFVHMLPAALDEVDGRVAVRPGADAAFVVRAGPAADSDVVAILEGGLLVRVR